jgi:predicted esterase
MDEIPLVVTSRDHANFLPRPSYLQESTMMRRRLFLSLFCLGLLQGPGAFAAAAAAPPAAKDDFPRGKLVEKVACKEHPEQTYALYLPSSYRSGRLWPILYAFDAGRRGKVPAEAFQAAAETWGWIVASSYNTASDGPMEPNFAAMRALWADTHARFAIDDKRVYAAGFSGTVRFSCILGLSAPGSLAGIFGAGAGFPSGTAPKADTPFAFFGTVGNRDFNYYEMMELDRQLDALHVPHRIEMFDGRHEWPPAELAGRGIAWLELAAMKKGLREKVPALVEQEWTADRERARAQEAAGHLWDAHHTWEAMVAEYGGLRDVSEAQKRAEEIAAGEPFKKQAKERQDRIARDMKQLAEAPQILAQANPGNAPVTVSQIASQLKIPQLKAREASADVEESLSAKRILNTYLVQTSYYLPSSMVEKKEYDRAVFMLSIAAEIRPEEPEIWVEIASVQARKGKAGHKKALEALHKAVDLGLSDPSVLEDETFTDLRQDEGFRQIAAQVAQRKQAPAKAGGGQAG